MSYYLTRSFYPTRPLRLLTPIEEEVHTPGPPLIAPADHDASAWDVDILDPEVFPRFSSALSSTTIDDEDAAERVYKTKATVPTEFEWRGGGDKVYVTGTMFQWYKKYQLHHVEGNPGLLKTVIHVHPGTHHLCFIVDGVMRCSKHLPTTVDLGNNLVNYIEVSANDLLRDTTSVSTETSGSLVAPEHYSHSETKSKVGDEVANTKPAPKTKPVLSDDCYSSQIPQYLLDLDKADNLMAATAMEKLPTPPSLDGFLDQSILDADSPVTGDDSVLTKPSHTALNHIATSRIEDNVLAVSVTTRYRQKGSSLFS